MTAEEYKKTIQAMDWQQLSKFWRMKAPPGWEKGKAFEYSIIRAFEIEGADYVRYPYNNGREEQIDGTIYVDSLCILVESKNYSKQKITIEPLAKLQVRLLRRPSSVIGCVFSTTDYTWPVQVLVETLEPKTILLWDKEDIAYCFKNRCFIETLKLKYRQVVECANHYFKVTVTP